MSRRPLATLALLSVACGPGASSASETSTTTSTTQVETETAETSVETATDTGTQDDPFDAWLVDYCEAWLSVTCPWPRYDSVEECIEHQTQELSGYVAQVEAGEMVFDEDCATKKIATLGGPTDCYAGACALFHGDTQQFGDCDTGPWGIASECDAGMRCTDIDGCQPICAIAGEGEVCNHATCEEGLLCVYDGDTPWATGTCVPEPAAGEPCLFLQSLCAQDMWCDQGLCSDQYAAVGEACDPTPCDLSQGFCEMGTCTDLLPLGASCTSWWTCASQACVLDQCVPLPDTVGAPCHQHRRCAGELECDSTLFVCREPFPGRACALSQWCASYDKNNGVCEEGDGPDDCPPGADASDCGYCPRARQGDGECGEPLFCAVGTDPDC